MRIKDEPKEALKLDDFVTASTKPRRLSPGPGLGDAETALKRLQTLSGRAPSPEVKRERSATPDESDKEAQPNMNGRSPSSSGTASPTGNEKKRRRVDEPVCSHNLLLTLV
jgi:hypothetical protein